MKITHAVALPDFRVELCFDDGVFGVVDLSSFAGRGVFREWETEGVFEKVHVTESGALEWPGEVDLCPDMLYLRLTARTPEEVFSSIRKHATHA